MKLKNLAIAALGLAAIAPVNQTAKSERGISISQKQKEGVVKPVKSARQIVREDAGGLQVMSYRPGIPPHIYGAHYVRRGTHKKTNK